VFSKKAHFFIRFPRRLWRWQAPYGLHCEQITVHPDPVRPEHPPAAILPYGFGYQAASGFSFQAVGHAAFGPFFGVSV
jgi:hypothetical protein